MKYLTILFFIFTVAILLVECTTAKSAEKPSAAAKEIAFDYPEDIVADTARKRFAREFKKGSILYKINCSKCHNITVGADQVIPDFSLPQLMDYEIRIQYPSHGDHLKESNITHDELEWIVLFLRYKKKSNYNINDVLRQQQSQ